MVVLADVHLRSTRVVTGPTASQQGRLPIWGVQHMHTRAFLLVMLSPIHFSFLVLFFCLPFQAKFFKR